MTLLDLTNQPLFTIYLFNELVLKMNHASLKLLELEAVLTLDFLLGNVEDLGEVTLQHLNVLSLLPDDALQAIFTCSQTLLQLVNLVLKVISLLGDFIKILSHLSIDFGKDAFNIIH